LYEILKPNQALVQIMATMAEYMPIVQPLTDGLPLDLAWRCMGLFGEVMGGFDACSRSIKNFGVFDHHDSATSSRSWPALSTTLGGFGSALVSQSGMSARNAASATKNDASTLMADRTRCATP
jgi:hypothetical protein